MDFRKDLIVTLKCCYIGYKLQIYASFNLVFIDIYVF